MAPEVYLQNFSYKCDVPREGAARWSPVFSRPRDQRAASDASSRRARFASRPEESDSRSDRLEQLGT